MGEDLGQGRPLIGRRFGNYVIEALIGAGGMGAVYRAVQPEIGKQVAIKFLSSSLSAQPELVQRFFAEARAVNLIQHDNIVDIFDFGNADGLSWFVMELLRGRSLTAVLAYEGRLSIPRTLDVCAQIADAIAAAHGRGIIHRDLKGDNIFLVTYGGREDFVKILDFGIAKLSDPGSLGGGAYSHTRTGAILGTPGYMSPEQGTGGTVDGRTDVYALGVIAYRMLTGRLPHEGVNHLEIVQKQLTQPPPPLRDLRPDASPALAELIHQMLGQKPEARPQKMAEVRDRLRSLQPNELRSPSQKYLIEPTIGAAPSSTTLSGASGQVDTQQARALAEEASRRRRRVGIMAGVASILLVGAAGTLFVLRPASPSAPPSHPPSVATVAPVVVRPARPPAHVAPATHVKLPAPPPVEAANGVFECLVETDPPGAQVVHGNRVFGATPVTLKLSDDPTNIKLHLSGYGDENLEIARDTEHAIVRLHKLVVPVPQPQQAPHAKPAVVLPRAPDPKPEKPKKPSIGLDD